MSDLVIHTENLTKQYNGVSVVKQLNLDIPKRAVVGFLGPNGAGKSTTIKLLLGLIRPSVGSGTIFGQDIQRSSLKIRQRVGYLAQQPRFDDTMTARQTLRFVAQLFFSGSTQAIEQRVDEALNLVGLTDKADRPVRGFSGGEIQRLGIAQAQINTPELLILDEPAAALDPMGRRDVLTIMDRLRDSTTIFYSTHILDDVQRISDHVVILNKGQLVTQGPIETLLNTTEDTVYTLSLRGDWQRAQGDLLAQPWVNQVQAQPNDSTAHLHVHVTDPGAADTHLLRTILASSTVQVLSYGRQTYELEDVFMQLVQEQETLP